MTKHFCDRCGKEKTGDELVTYSVYREGTDDAIIVVSVCRRCKKVVEEQLAGAIASGT